MNVYHVTYVRAGCYAMNAVVVADSEQGAIDELDWSSEEGYETEIQAVALGPYTGSSNVPYVVASESL